MDKREFRKILKDKLSAFSPKEREVADVAIASRLFASPLYQEAGSLFLYISMPEEADTHRIIARALSDGKAVYLPRVEGEDMRLVRYEGGAFAVGAYGLSEPKGEASDPIVDLAVIPLLGFDRARGRLGRGKGFYDRFLASYHGRSLALAYAFQEIPSVPTEPHDCRPEGILTEKEWIE